MAAARRQWQCAAGRAGRLHTGHRALRVRDGAVVGETGRTGTTTVHFGVPAQEDLDAYLASGEPLHAASAFTLRRTRPAGSSTASRGNPPNVIGLRLPLLRVLPGRCSGVSVAALWAANRLIRIKKGGKKEKEIARERPRGEQEKKRDRRHGRGAIGRLTICTREI